MANTIVTGIDIGTKYITAAIIEMTQQKPKILGVEHFTIEANIFADNNAQVYQDCVKKLSKVKNLQPLFQHRVAIAIPDVMVMSKTVPTDKRLPFDQQRLAAMHSFSSSSPFEPDDLCFDYKQNSESIDIYAARKSVVLQRSRLIEKSGMRPILVDTERQAFLQLLWVAQLFTPQVRPFLIELSGQQLTIGALVRGSFLFQHIPLNSSTSETSLSIRIVQELDRVALENDVVDRNAIWFINQLDHDDLINKLLYKSYSYVGDYPLSDYFYIKRSWEAKTSVLFARACGIALRGITAMENNYAS